MAYSSSPSRAGTRPTLSVSPAAPRPGREAPGTPGISYRGVVGHEGRKVSRRARWPAANRFYGRMRRAARGFLGRVRLGVAAAPPRVRRWTLAAVLLGVVLAPYPSPRAVTGAPVS